MRCEHTTDDKPDCTALAYSYTKDEHNPAGVTFCCPVHMGWTRPAPPPPPRAAIPSVAAPRAAVPTGTNGVARVAALEVLHRKVTAFLSGNATVLDLGAANAGLIQPGPDAATLAAEQAALDAAAYADSEASAATVPPAAP